MPKKTINDYTFYKIVNINGDIDLCYVGSTVNMKERKRTHKNTCHNPNMPKYHLKVYQTIREHGGWNEFKIIEIGTAEQLTLAEAHVIEEMHRVNLGATLNNYKCFRTDEEKNETNCVCLCECGCEVSRKSICSHRRTKKHNDRMLKILD